MSAERRVVFLVGPMGSGKTTVGTRLARLLGLEFLDCDHELEAHTGASVSLIFDVEGEEGFRERETRMLETMARREGVLIATGGGVVLRAENRDLMRRSGLVVYLKTSVAQQLKRLSRDRSRPLLQTGDRQGRLQRLAEERNALYESVADVVYVSRNRSPDAAAERLAAQVRERLEAGEPRPPSKARGPAPG